MDMRPEPFVPPAPIPRTVPPSRLEIIRTVLNNPLELWGVPSYTLPWIETKFITCSSTNLFQNRIRAFPAGSAGRRGGASGKASSRYSLMTVVWVMIRPSWSSTGT